MSDPSKVVLFGSFTEDETKSWLNQASSNVKTPDKRIEFQVNSSKVIPQLTFGSFSSISNIQDSSPNGLVSLHPTDPQKGYKQLDAKPSDEHLPSVTANGKITNTDNCYDNQNQATINGTNFPSLSLLDNDNETTRKSSSRFPDFDGVNLNGSTINSAVEAHYEEAHLKKDGPVLAAQDILPRGLINSGNLCFLNATLQALLSCSPFVLFLQGLRSRSIPKVGYPTLTAFSEFITEFDVPGGANMKDTTVIETGRSFRPIMFEAVLRNFTPDVPSTISGRPRQEDAQEFLCFILHQMHDELLKFEGQSQLDGKNSSLVSISEGDEWETVGPRNTSAVIRTQNFAPSELSTIFGGQLRSVVKAKVSGSDLGDLWCDDGSSCDDSIEKSALPSDMDREWQRRRDQFHTIGYRDGLIAGKETSAQEGFNIGFRESVLIGYNWGLVRGITSAMTFLLDELKEKLVETDETRSKLQDLHKSVHSLSTTDALKLFYEGQKRKSGNQNENAKPSSNIADLNNQNPDVNVLQNYYGELESLISESHLVDVHLKTNQEWFTTKSCSVHHFGRAKYPFILFYIHVAKESNINLARTSTTFFIWYTKSR